MLKTLQEKFPSHLWLVYTRRIVQIASFLLFFFLLFHTQKFKELEIPLLNYTFVILIAVSIYFLISSALSKWKKLKTFFIFSGITIALSFFLNHFDQLSKPERISYLDNKELSIKEAVKQYDEAKERYLSIYHWQTLRTKISSKTEGDIEFIFPPLLLYTLYLALFSSLFLILLSIKRKLSRSDYSIKGSTSLAIMLILISLIPILLLEFDFLPGNEKLNLSSGYILNIFPTDFSHYYYFISIPQNLFLKSSSLLGVVTSIALKTIVIGLAFTLFFLIISYIFGRVFCGWVCPFGTFHQIISFFKMKIKKKYDHEVYKTRQKTKYFILTIVLASAIFSINLAGFLDPISLLTKSSAVFLVPASQYAVVNTYEPIQKAAEQEWPEGGGFFTLLDNLYRPVKKYLDENVFYFTDPAETTSAYVPTHYEHFFLNGVIFMIFILLNLRTTRFWCRYICPLGALLGIFGNRSLMRIQVNNNCTSCGDCEKFCQGAADVSIKDGFKTSECMYCFNCMKACPSNALEIKWAKPSLPFTSKKPGDLPVQNLDLNRRRLAWSMGLGLTTLFSLRAAFWEKRSAPEAIRPPGSVMEADFLAKCIKCSECMKVCPKNFLHPAFLETGVEGMFTPIGIGKLGYCEHTCNACGQVCPTQAIEAKPLYEKQELKIGLAIIRKDRCLTYASQTPCLVCEEHCPTSPKAIWTHKKEVKKRTGETFIIDQINVDPDLCIGCAVCEYVCPVVDKPAIFVSSIQETRSKENQLLLREEQES